MQQEKQTDTNITQPSTEKREYESPVITPISINSGTKGKAPSIVEVSIGSGTGS